RRIDLVDAVAGDLEEVPAVEGRPGIAGDVQGAHDPVAAWRTRLPPRRPGRAARGAGSAAGGRGRLFSRSPWRLILTASSLLLPPGLGGRYVWPCSGDAPEGENMKHPTGTRKEWLAARLELLEAEKELTRRSDELARRRQELPWVRIAKEYRFETDEG